jgi:hypothetical protein
MQVSMDNGKLPADARTLMEQAIEALIPSTNRYEHHIETTCNS